MKAWRLDAVNVNARRLAGSKEPSARVQKAQRMAVDKITKNASTWLLDGLLIRAGILDPLPVGERRVATLDLERGTVPAPGWWQRAVTKVKSLLN